MIDLNAHEHERLREISRAEAEGLPLAQVGAAMAIRLALEAFVTITKGDDQRVIITRKGVAHLRRVVFA